MEIALLALAGLQLVVAGLVGALVWMVHDVRHSQQRRFEAVEERVGDLVERLDERVPVAACAERHRDVAAKLKDLDSAREEARVKIVKMEAR